MNEEMNNTVEMDTVNTDEALTGEVVETSRFGLTKKEAEGMAIIGGCAILAYEGGKAVVKKLSKTKVGIKVTEGVKNIFKKKEKTEDNSENSSENK